MPPPYNPPITYESLRIALEELAIPLKKEGMVGFQGGPRFHQTQALLQLGEDINNHNFFDYGAQQRNEYRIDEDDKDYQITINKIKPYLKSFYERNRKKYEDINEWNKAWEKELSTVINDEIHRNFIAPPSELGDKEIVRGFTKKAKESYDMGETPDISDINLSSNYCYKTTFLGVKARCDLEKEKLKWGKESSFKEVEHVYISVSGRKTQMLMGKYQSGDHGFLYNVTTGSFHDTVISNVYADKSNTKVHFQDFESVFYPVNKYDLADLISGKPAITKTNSMVAKPIIFAVHALPNDRGKYTEMSNFIRERLNGNSTIEEPYFVQQSKEQAERLYKTPTEYNENYNQTKKTNEAAEVNISRSNKTQNERAQKFTQYPIGVYHVDLINIYQSYESVFLDKKNQKRLKRLDSPALEEIKKIGEKLFTKGEYPSYSDLNSFHRIMESYEEIEQEVGKLSNLINKSMRPKGGKKEIDDKEYQNILDKAKKFELSTRVAINENSTETILFSQKEQSNEDGLSSRLKNFSFEVNLSDNLADNLKNSKNPPSFQK